MPRPLRGSARPFVPRPVRPSALYLPERLESRMLLAADGHMQIGMNLENVVDWSPAWMFTDAFKASRGWIAQELDTTTWAMTWDVGTTNPVQLDGDGNVVRLTTRTASNGHVIQQMAGTLMFRDLGGGYPGGIYHAEWDGTGVVTFGFDATTIASGRTASGRSYADLLVTPGNDGILMRIEATTPSDPARNFNVWMPAWNGQSFAGQAWHPGDAFSPFHPLFLERLEPFGVIRFMQPQETNSSDIRTWADRRDADDIRQGSGSEGSPSEPIVNGMSVEYMVQLANDLHADPWFNMPYMADDTFVRNFATYVRDHLEPGRHVYVEWANEVWNFAWGFEAAAWVQSQTALPEYAGLDNWQVAGREAKRDLDIWSDVFTGQTDRLVRVAAGWAANDWVTGRIVESMTGSFDAIAIAPYFSPNDTQRDGYTSATSVEAILADCRTAIDEAVGWTLSHRGLADQWSQQLGRPIQLVAYEGGIHLDGRNAAYQNAFYAATNDPRMGDLYDTYLRALDAAGMNLFVDFVFTGQAGAAPWGDFAKLHRMDEPLTAAYRYNAVVAAATRASWPSVDVIITVDAGGTVTDTTVRSGDVRLVKQGPGILVIDTGNSHSGGTVVEEGTVELRDPDGLGLGFLEVRAGATVRFDLGLAAAILPEVRIEAGGVIDLGTSRLTIAADGFDADSLWQWIAAGRAGGAWLGSSGIRSAAAAAAPDRLAIGYRIATDGSVTLVATALGDLDLDGDVDAFDIVSLQGAGGYGSGLPVGWSGGDVDYSGRADILDLVAISSAARFGLGPLGPSGLADPITATAVAAPQPTAANPHLSVPRLLAFRDYATALNWLDDGGNEDED